VKALKSRIVLLCLFLLGVSLTVLVPEVQAQTTSISNLQYPKSAMLGAGTNIKVSFVVTYSGASRGSYGYGSLVAGVFDADTSGYATGTASSSSDSCVSTPKYADSAVCGLYPSTASGSITFSFGLRFYSSKTYRLSAAAMLASSTDSFSSQDFSITVSDKLQLIVTVPYGVAVSVDGATQQPGNAFLAVYPGTHQISVPATVDVASDERWKFDHWTDGQTQTSRTENLQDDAIFGAVYVKQYSLTLQSSQAAATGAGWYDEGAIATFSVVTPQPMSGLYGLLGGMYVFDHWSGDSAATTPTASLTMDKPGTVKAEWRTDYTMPYIVIGAIAATVAIVVLLLAMRRRRRPETAAATAPAQPIPQASVAAPPTVTGDKFCMNCGAPLPTHATFCNKCGTKQ